MKKICLLLALAAGFAAAQTTSDYGGRVIVNGVNNVGTIAGTNTYTVTVAAAITAYQSNVTYCGTFTNANTGAATINFTPSGGSALGAVSIVKQSSTALASGDIAAGSSHCLLYNGTAMVIQSIDNSPNGSSAGTPIQKGNGSGGFSNATASDIGSETYIAGGGTAQAQTVTLSPAAASLTGLTVRWLPAAANTGAAPTLAVNGLTATSITKCGTAALVANDLTTTAVATATYDGTQFQLLNPQAGPCGSTITVASGTAALGTSAISSGACATVVTVSATGVATTDDIQADFNADPTSTTGYSPTSSGILTIVKYPTANNVNFKVCNNTGGSITPGAVTLNWRVVR